ncbi:MAG: type II toxin-antitoxin system VapC family toxin, partial [Deltaproteobacteria bacterium]
VGRVPSPGFPVSSIMRIADYTVLDLDRDMAWAASQIARQLRSSGTLLGENDVWIAATALHHNLALVTNNVQHFQRVSGLQVARY